jgi:hypothetical protein
MAADKNQMNDYEAKILFLDGFYKQLIEDVSLLKKETADLKQKHPGQDASKEDANYLRGKLDAVVAKYEDPNGPFYIERFLDALREASACGIPAECIGRWSSGYSLAIRFFGDASNVFENKAKLIK